MSCGVKPVCSRLGTDHRAMVQNCWLVFDTNSSGVSADNSLSTAALVASCPDKIIETRGASFKYVFPIIVVPRYKDTFCKEYLVLRNDWRSSKTVPALTVCLVCFFLPHRKKHEKITGFKNSLILIEL